MSDYSNLEMPDGFDHQAFLSIDSTNKEAIRQIDKGVGSGHWITSDEQVGGRGRGGREWVSKAGNLYSTLIYDTNKSLCHSAQLSFVTSLAVRDTVAAFVNSGDVKCKWPNDVLVDGAKISGILLETYSKHGGPNLMIIGIGINVAHHPDNTLYPTTHINDKTDKPFGHFEVFHILAGKMAEWLHIWQEHGFPVIRDEWLKHAKGQGEMIKVRLPDQELNGRFVDLDSQGALKLDMGNEIKLIHSGDVFFPNDT
ncbi:biotin--[acetyl-CoA-carboxylase] ligase [Pseudemcibacter aquimaris]|uniref:biotin--[acetyl-CoA-carboxylase] ligase n=1 Tax=Pseudemcibacter aquimaris TaxID=2857064 RepID=UPI002010E034|nr:biotin--[acetyl-CoA-carboxylase] ligase [Pseudemcibacter aquimaris]MCC3860869.1 biotin--[acetyl-CoA-carboxylase] ligase [Pseudemcibacter aquimaris]WDU59687.1 biotin--[acetyl-CoA-carboxylase] ligase [Pseudemcibacter aquimaris]